MVYSSTAMARLAAAGPVLYLESDFKTLEERVSATPDRGIASAGEQSFADIFAERIPLYQRYADKTIDTADATAEEVAMAILEGLRHK